MASSVDPDQTPRFAASDLALHCLHRPVRPNAAGIYGNILENVFVNAMAVGAVKKNQRVHYGIFASYGLFFALSNSGSESRPFQSILEKYLRKKNPSAFSRGSSQNHALYD